VRSQVECFRGTKVPPGLTRGAALADQAQLARPGDGLGAAGRAGLAEEVADVLLDGAGGDHQLARDAPVTPYPRVAGGQRPGQATYAMPGPGSAGWPGAAVISSARR